MQSRKISFEAGIGGCVIGIIIVLLATLVASSQIVNQANHVSAAPRPAYWMMKIDGMTDPHCSDTDFSFKSAESFITPPLIANVKTRLVYKLNTGYTADTGLDLTAMFPVDSSGWITHTMSQHGYRVATGTEYTVEVIHYLYVDGLQKSMSILATSCSPGPNRTLKYLWIVNSGQGISPLYQGSNPGFDMRPFGVRCNTPIYDSPGGAPLKVGVNELVAGQNWFFKPKAIKDNRRTSWAETFVAGYPNGFVPTKCLEIVDSF